jgi:hypothetical protein
MSAVCSKGLPDVVAAREDVVQAARRVVNYLNRKKVMHRQRLKRKSIRINYMIIKGEQTRRCDGSPFGYTEGKINLYIININY